MTTDRLEPLTTRLRTSLSHHRRSVLLFVVLGLVLGGLLAVRQIGISIASVDIAASNDPQLIAGLELADGVARTLSPQAEVFYINHNYESVTATLVGELVVVKAAERGERAALNTLKEFLDDYLRQRNDGSLAAYEAARSAAEATATAYEADLEAIDEALSDASAAESTRTELAVQRATISSNLTRSRSLLAGYSSLLEGSGPVEVYNPPAIEDRSLVATLFPSILAIAFLAAVAVAQAWWRDGGPTKASGRHPTSGHAP